MADKDNEIKNILKKIMVDYESVLKEQRERILLQREENRKLAEENAALKRKESEISKAMLAAVSKAREIEEASKLRYRAEMQRLREFHVRWKKYYDCLYQLAPARDYSQLRELLAKMDGVFEGDLLIGEDSLSSAYRTETERVNLREAELASGEADFSELFGEDSEGAADDSVAAEDTRADAEDSFDLDEVLYPKNLPDLDSLCEEMGLK